MKKLSFYHNGIKFINPFLLASGPPARNAEMIERAFKAGWGGAVTKTICLQPETIKNLSPGIYGYKINSELSGLKNIEMISETPVKTWTDDIKYLKDKYPDRIIVASIMSDGHSTEDWQKLTELMQEAGADILELNLSCPNGVHERAMGSYCSEIPQLCADIIKSVKEVSRIPVWAKLSPNVTSISETADYCLDAGADGIVAINTVKGFAGINIETSEPCLSVDGLSTYGGFSGAMIKPVALKAVTEIALEHKAYISGCGGIRNWQDAAEFMLSGASSLQLCTEVMFRGYDIIKPLCEGLSDYLDRHNYDSVQALTGLALNKITNFGSLNNKIKYCAEIDQNTCTKCGNCFVSCRDGAYQAIDNVNNNYSINKDKCIGCGLCLSVCPADAVSLYNKNPIIIGKI